MTQLSEHRFAGDQRRSGFVTDRGLASGGDVVQHIAILPFQCGYDRHRAFDKAATPLALCPETALAPQDAGPHGSFPRVIGGLHAFGLYEDPQRILEPQNVATRARCSVWSQLTALRSRSPTRV